MKEFIQNLEWYTLLTGALTIISATITFILDRASERDERKEFLGVFNKDLKRYAAYLTLIFTILTLTLEVKHKIDEKLNSIVERQNEEKKQKDRFDATLVEIGKTLTKQDKTLRLQDALLKTQNTTLFLQDSIITRTYEILKNQIQTLNAQTTTLSQNSLIIESQNTQFLTLKKVLINVDEINGSTIKIIYTQEITPQKSSYRDNFTNGFYFAKFPHDKETFDKIINRMKADSLQYGNFNSNEIDVRGKLEKIKYRNIISDFVFEMYLLDSNAKTLDAIQKTISSSDSIKWNYSKPYGFKGYEINPLSSIPYKHKLTFDVLYDQTYFFYLSSPVDLRSKVTLDYNLKVFLNSSQSPITFDDLENQLVLIKIKPENLGFRIDDLTFMKQHKSLEVKNIDFLRERWGGSMGYGSEREQYYLLQFGNLKYASQ